MTPPPAAAPSAPVVCSAPTAADHIVPGRVTASAGDVAGKAAAKPVAQPNLSLGTKPGTKAGTKAGTKPIVKAHQWTVQVASFESLADAQSMQQSLCGHGYEARVIGTARPFVVRVGRFPTSQDALVAARRLSSPKLTVFVTQAER